MEGAINMEGISYWYVEISETVSGQECWMVIKTPDYWSQDVVYDKLAKSEDVGRIIELEPLNEPDGHFSYNNISLDYVQFITNGINF